MSFNGQFPRQRGPSNGTGGLEARNASGFVPGIDGGMSRAERFEDEKRRICESCFNKTDTDGQVTESYITHIRILEDAAFPSSPPPPNSPPENKKPRIIVVAVRRSGRVRMHKARENGNGTFSIGKTWVLDDLTIIESFIGINPRSAEDQQKKDWAGSVGFLVTIQKPYYWQATTSKERDFFIGSLIKIYRKYTGGKLPELLGFDEDELAQLTGVPNARQAQPPGSARSGASPVTSLNSQSAGQPSPLAEGSRERQPGQSQQPINEAEETSPGQQTADPVRGVRPQESKSRMQALRGASPASSLNRSESSNPPSPLEERNPRSFNPTQSTESFQSRRDQQRNRIPPNPHPSIDRLRNDAQFLPNSRGDSPGRSGASTPNPPYSSSLRPGGTPSPRPPQEQLPERKRPPISIATVQAGNRSLSAESPQEFVTPVMSPVNGETEKPISPLVFNRGRTSGPTTNGQRELDDRQGYFPTQTSPPKKNLQPESSNPSPSLAQASLQQQVTPLSEAPRPIERLLDSPSLPIETPLGTPPVPETPAESEIHRPGLGPMIKKKSNKEIANAFRRAATAANAFKPRAGGAASRLQGEAAKVPGVADGINGVFPATPRSETPTNAVRSETPVTGRPSSPEKPLLVTQNVKETPPPNVPEVTITETPATRPTSPEEPAQAPSLAAVSATQLAPSPQVPSQEERRRKRPSNYAAKYAKALGIDPNLLEGRTSELESVLDEFGWGEEEKSKSNYQDLHEDLQRELASVETGKWLGTFEQNDERVGQVSRLLDKAIAECDELDGLLALFNVELSTLSEDVAYIEAQSQGLQVQTANQRLLQSELQNLLDTIMISSLRLQDLKEASLQKPQGVHSIETTLVQLYRALVTIDPKLRQGGSRPPTADRLSVNDPTGNLEYLNSEVSTMRAVQERKDEYRKESFGLLFRFKQCMSIKFREAEVETTDALERSRKSFDKSVGVPTKLDSRIRENSRSSLWTYSPLMLFTREIDSSEWEDLLRMYENTAKKPYQEEYLETIAAWKKVTKKPLGDEQETLFTSQEKEAEGIVGRKLTVKRSKTVREGVRHSSGDKRNDGSMNGYESFAGALFDTAHSISIEQNFIITFFHASSLENMDFPDVVAAVQPEARTGADLLQKRLFDPDRQMAKRVQNVMEDIFSFWTLEIDSLVEWVIKQDPLQGVGVLFALEAKTAELEESNQDFLIQTIAKTQTKLVARFDRFVDEQIRAIEDTKVKIKKRKGVISFMKTFPYFAAAIESMLPMPRANRFDVRHTVNDVYTRINKAMFESLKFIAKESPLVLAGAGSGHGHSKGGLHFPTGGSSGTSAAAGTPGLDEDKEILNYHILLIENMNHYVEEVDVRDNPVLAEWKERAVSEMAEHMQLYLSTILRRPLGKLLDFLESMEALLAQNEANGIEDPKSVATKASHSRSSFKKLMAGYDAKEVRRGIEALKKRVEKHFGEGDDAVVAKALVGKVLKRCEEKYVSVVDRLGKVNAEIYTGEGVEVEFGKGDVTAAFKK